MSGEPENLVLVYLRRLDAKLDRIQDDLADLKPRMTAVETNLAQLTVQVAGQSARMDRIDQRLERVEHRLDLIGTPA